MRLDMTETLYACIQRVLKITVNADNVGEMLSVAATHDAIFYFYCDKDKWKVYHIVRDFATLWAKLNDIPSYSTWRRWCEEAATGYTLANWRDKKIVQDLYVGLTEKYKDVQHYLSKDGFPEIRW